jgi:hypothetical protein
MYIEKHVGGGAIRRYVFRNLVIFAAELATEKVSVV